MALDWNLLLALLTIGLSVGFFAGLLGIGGGSLMVPCLVWLLVRQGLTPDMAIKMAIATSMNCIVFIAINSSYSHYRRGTVRLDILRSFLPGIVIGALICSIGVFALLKGQWLALLFAFFVLFTAYQMLRPTADVALGSRQLPGSLGQVSLGAGLGFVSGLLGVGGGFIAVPLLTYFSVPILTAISTSAAISLPIALTNTIGYIVAGWQESSALLPWSLGFVWLPAVAAITLGSLFSTALGVRLAHSISPTLLKRFFAGFLCILAAYMLYQSSQF